MHLVSFPHYNQHLVLLQKLFFTDFHQNDIRPDFFNTTERNHIFSVTAKYPADLPGNRNDDRQNLSIADINIHIHHTAKSSAVTYIDYFFLSQFTEPHTSHPLPEIRSAAIKSACIQQQPSYCYYMQAPSLCEMLCLKQSLFCHYLFTFKCFCDYRNQYHSQDQCLCQCHRILHHTHISCKNSL